MGVPQAVQKQGEAAKKMQESLAQGIPVNVVDDKNKAPEKQPSNEDVQEKDKQTIEQPKANVDVETPQDGDFKHKYDVLQGKYNTEMKEMRLEIQALRNNLQQANATIASLNELVMETGSKIPKDDDEPGKSEKVIPKGSLNIEDYEGYGDEMVDMVNLVNSLKQQNETLLNQINDLGGEVQVVGKTIKEESANKFYDALTKLVPDWRKVNKEQGWLQWLGNEDPGTGEVRQDLLDKAHQKGSVQSVAHWFKSWMNESGYKPGTGTGNQPGSRSLEDEVVPGETSGSEGPVDTGAFKVVTREQFQKAAKDRVDGKITSEQFLKIQQNFQRSIREGKT